MTLPPVTVNDRPKGGCFPGDIPTHNHVSNFPRALFRSGRIFYQYFRFAFDFWGRNQNFPYFSKLKLPALKFIGRNIKNIDFRIVLKFPAAVGDFFITFLP